jgi:hypothetical protein
VGAVERVAFRRRKGSKNAPCDPMPTQPPAPATCRARRRRPAASAPAAGSPAAPARASPAPGRTGPGEKGGRWWEGRDGRARSCPTAEEAQTGSLQAGRPACPPPRRPTPRHPAQPLRIPRALCTGGEGGGTAARLGDVALVRGYVLLEEGVQVEQQQLVHAHHPAGRGRGRGRRARGKKSVGWPHPTPSATQAGRTGGGAVGAQAGGAALAVPVRGPLRLGLRPAAVTADGGAPRASR